MSASQRSSSTTTGSDSPSRRATASSPHVIWKHPSPMIADDGKIEQRQLRRDCRRQPEAHRRPAVGEQERARREGRPLARDLVRMRAHIEREHAARRQHAAHDIDCLMRREAVAWRAQRRLEARAVRGECRAGPVIAAGTGARERSDGGVGDSPPPPARSAPIRRCRQARYRRARAAARRSTPRTRLRSCRSRARL